MKQIFVYPLDNAVQWQGETPGECLVADASVLCDLGACR